MKYRNVMFVFAAVLLTPAVAFAAGGDGGFPWAHWGASMFNFAVFLGILIYFAGPKIQEFFKTRAVTLKSDIDEAKRLRAEAQEKLDEFSSRLAKLDDERAELMDQYHEQGEREKERIVADAKRQVEKMRADAELIIQQETRKAVAALERQAVDLAVNMARKSLEQKIDERMQNTLVDSYVSDLKSMEG